jgi:uncharacterized protein (TIGR00290 family)
MKVLLSWSSGKDSAMALHMYKMQCPDAEIVLFTTVGENTKRVGLHGLHISVLKEQATCLRLPLEIVYIPEEPSMEVYESALLKFLGDFNKSQGVREVVFGDIHLQDLRDYKASLACRVGLKSVFPLWGMSSAHWLHYFTSNGFEAKVLAIQSEKVPPDLLGGNYNEEWLRGLSSEVDLCGENGEFHTLCTFSPDFCRPLKVVEGRRYETFYSQGELSSSVHFLELKVAEP